MHVQHDQLLLLWPMLPLILPDNRAVIQVVANTVDYMTEASCGSCVAVH